MSSSDLAIAVRGLSKAYTIRHQHENQITLAEQALQFVRRPLTRPAKETFWALDDVSFDVHKGEVLGVIGRNGAGKSTLLKVLSRITAPTKGEVRLYGRVGSLLEVGTGFHPELTGRENVYLNGSILGMRRKEIDKQFDAIVDFAGVEKFLDTPVKRYSSGMYVRLAFAVAAHLETEILLIDEVLAVGDAEFQKKSIRKMGETAADGRTVILVSHQLDMIERIADRGVVLRNGRAAFTGTPQAALGQHLADRSGASDAVAARRAGTGEYRIVEQSARSDTFGVADEKVIDFDVAWHHGDLDRYYVSAVVLNEFGHAVAHCDSRFSSVWAEHALGTTHRFQLTIRTPWLPPGSYTANLFVCNAGIIDALEAACKFDVLPGLPYPGTGSADGLAHAAVLADFSYKSQGVV